VERREVECQNGHPSSGWLDAIRLYTYHPRRRACDSAESRGGWHRVEVAHEDPGTAAGGATHPTLRLGVGTTTGWQVLASDIGTEGDRFRFGATAPQQVDAAGPGEVVAPDPPHLDSCSIPR